METIELQATVTKELSDELFNKLDGNEFAGEIDRLTKELNINWHLKPESKTLVASRTFTGPGEISPAHIYSFKADVCAFVAKVKRLKHEEDVPAVNNNTPDEEYDFIKMLIDTWDATEDRAQTTGFAVLAGMEGAGFMIERPCARIPEKLAKELCMCYLKVHSHDGK